MINPGLKDRCVLVTGANSGIGAAIALAFGEQGCHVAVHYLPGSSGRVPRGVTFQHTVRGRSVAEEVAGEVRRSGRLSIAFDADLSDPDAIYTLFGRVEQEIGAPEILVNNAAHCEIPDLTETMKPSTFDRHMAVNARAPLLLAREYVSRYKDHRFRMGRIINVTSDTSVLVPGQVTHAASKAALESMTKGMAAELGPLGITVNAIAPGPIQTGWLNEEGGEEIVSRIPMGRVGTPEDVANLVVFLASEQAGWLTGQVIGISGGYRG